MINLSSYVLPLIVLIVIIYGNIKKVDVYDTFIEGAKESFKLVLTMFPCLLAMILAINIFLKSGVLDFLLSLIKVSFPTDVISLALLRPISGSSSLAILNKILSEHGTDSKIGIMSSIIQGSTDTTFYIISLYFGSIGIKKIRHSLIVGLLADLAGILISILFVNLFF